MANYMGHKLRHIDSTDTGGSSYLVHVGHAKGHGKVEGHAAHRPSTLPAVPGSTRSVPPPAGDH